MAIASSYKDKAYSTQECFVGGLTGEVRRVNRIEQRIIEAEELRIPWQESLHPRKLEVIGVIDYSGSLKKVFA